MSKESARESARLAMKDLFGGYGDAPAAAEEPVAAAPAKKQEPVAEAVVEAVAETVREAKGSTVIGSGTKLIGSVETPDELEIYGFINGDINCAADVHLYGRVMGNVKCRNFFQHAGAVKGDVDATETVRLEREGAVLGNLKCTTFLSDGKVSGDISASHNVELLANAVVVGDVNTGFFVMKDTACLKGVVKLNCEDANTSAAFEGCFNF